MIIGCTCRDGLSSERFSQEKLGSDAGCDGKGRVLSFDFCYLLYEIRDSDISQQQDGKTVGSSQRRLT